MDRAEAILISDPVVLLPMKRVRILTVTHVWKEVGKPQGIRHRKIFGPVKASAESCNCRWWRLRGRYRAMGKLVEHLVVSGGTAENYHGLSEALEQALRRFHSPEETSLLTCNGD